MQRWFILVGQVFMNIYVLGICGTFMSGIAQLAIQKGFKVSGCDENIYPPISNVLKELEKTN